ncbi:MAG: type II toxin-antitoxin system Phd/YefM family antitoxin [Marinifilaceae bacterium]
MKTVNYSELRTHLKSNLDEVSENQETLIVHRSGGKSVVMISMDEYNSWMETIHLIKSQANRERLEQSIKNVKEHKNVSPQNLIED